MKTLRTLSKLGLKKLEDRTYEKWWRQMDRREGGQKNKTLIRRHIDLLHAIGCERNRRAINKFMGYK